MEEDMVEAADLVEVAEIAEDREEDMQEEEVRAPPLLTNPQQSPPQESDLRLIEEASEHYPDNSFSHNFELIKPPTGEKDLRFYEYLKTSQIHLKAKGYNTADSIHSDNAIQFYSSVLNASDSILNILKFGYMPEFKESVPNFYSEPNNRSALQNMPFVR